MWRVVGIGVGLLRHDGEVEGVVVKDDAFIVGILMGWTPDRKRKSTEQSCFI